MIVCEEGETDRKPRIEPRGKKWVSNPTQNLERDAWPHHDHFYGDGNGQLGFVFVVDLLHDEDHHHDHDGHDQVADIGGGDLDEDQLQGLCKRQRDTSGSRNPFPVSCFLFDGTLHFC